jgi:tetratricopeptide (TPR) repeat protein/serine phosphatase RsbU (regulator of sigma subunit)
MRFFISFFILLFIAEIHATYSQQQSEIDSLLNTLSKHSQEDTLKVRILNQLCWKNRNNDFVSAISFGKQGLELAQNIDDYYGQAEVLNFMGVVYRNMGDYIDATQRFFEALKISEKHNLTQQIAYSNNNIGDILKAQKKYQDALPYSQKALKIFQTLKDERGMGYAYVRLGEIFQSLKQYEQAIDNFQKSLTIRIKLRDNSTLITSYNRIGTVHASKKEYKKALEFYQKGLDLSKQLGDKRATAGCLDNIAWVHVSLNDFSKAEEYSLQSLSIAKSINAKVDEKNAFFTLALLYDKQSKLGLAYDFYKKYVILNDSIDNIEKATQLAKMQAVYDTKKKEQENELLRKENELNARDARLKNLIILLVSIAFLLTLGMIYFVYQSRQKQVRLNNTLANQKEEIESQRDTLVKLNEEVEKKNEEIIRKKNKLEKNIEILSKLSTSKAMAEGDWQVLSKQITKSVIEALEVDICQLWYYNFKEKNFYCLNQDTLITQQNINFDVLPVADVPIFFQVLQNQNHLLINDIHHHGLDEKTKAYIFKEGVQSAIIFPCVLSQNQKLLIVCFHHQPKIWELEDLTFLKSMNDEMSIAYQAYRRKEAQKRIEKQNNDITASINYAKRIQTAFLPLEEAIASVIPSFFIFYQPRDIVSGDFYWFEQKDNKAILAAADCTGHGVPGALMSMIGNEILNQIVIERGITEADKILNELNKGIRTALKQEITKNADGMDISLIVIDYPNKIMEFAGAKNPLYYIQNQGFRQIKADVFSIGGEYTKGEKIFTKHLIDISVPTTFYIGTDGFQDQFGGEANKKFMVKHLRELFFTIHDKDMNEQKDILHHTITNWIRKGKTEQTDDILWIGGNLF